LKHSDKNAKIRDGSKNTTKDNLKCSSSNDSMMRTIPEESNASENNPNSKLTSAGSSSDHSSCDAKKVKIVKMQPVMILMIQVLILTFKVKMPILALNMQVLMGMQLLKNRIMILTLKIQMLMKMEKKRQESKIASEDDAASEDVNAGGNATIEKQKHNSNSEDSNGNENEKKSW
jgi:hypothetical protein